MAKRSCTIALGEKEEAKIVRTNRMKPTMKTKCTTKFRPQFKLTRYVYNIFYICRFPFPLPPPPIQIFLIPLWSKSN